MAHHHHDHVGGGADMTSGNERRVLMALMLTGGFMVIEVIGGLWTGSLALLADAGHMLTDTASLALAWAAFRVSRWPNDPRRSFGYHRFQVLAAFVNGGSLIVIVVWIAVEAMGRLMAPSPVLGGPMLVIAGIGMVVNVIALLILRGGGSNMNLRGAALHVLGDFLGSVAAIIAAIVILQTGWMPIDPLLSILVGLLILRSAWYLVRRSGHILLEGAPDWLDTDALRSELRDAIPGVVDIHHVHAWMLTDERPLMTLHAAVDETADPRAVLAAIAERLESQHGIAHATIQLEPAGYCSGPNG